MSGEFFAAIETGEILLRVIGDGGGFGGGEGLPFFASGEGVESEIDLFCFAGERAGEGFEFAGGDAFGFGAEVFAVLFDEFHGAAGIGILIGAATEGGEGDGAGEFALEGFLSDAGPVAVDFIDADGGAVAGVAGEDGAHFAIGVGDAEDGEIVIDGLQGEEAAVGGEADFADAPGEGGGFAIGESGAGGFFDVVGEFAGVALDGGEVLGGDVHAEEIGKHADEHGSAMGVAGADGEAGVGGFVVCLETAQDFGAHGGGDTDVVDGDENGGAFGIAAEGEGFGEDVLGDAGVGGAAVAVAAEADGVVGGDVDGGGTGGDESVGCETREWQEEEDEEAEVHGLVLEHYVKAAPVLCWSAEDTDLREHRFKHRESLEDRREEFLNQSLEGLFRFASWQGGKIFPADSGGE